MNLSQIKIYYKILEVNHIDNTILVRYYTDFLSEDELDALPSEQQKREDGTPFRCRTDSNLSIWDHIKTEEDIHNHIIQCAPIEWFKIQKKVKEGEINPILDIMYSQKDQVFNKQVAIDAVRTESLLTDEEIDDLILKLSNKKDGIANT